MSSHPLLLIFGNQLFAPRHLPGGFRGPVLMVEDQSLCQRYGFHKQKLVFVLAAMRAHAEQLRAAGHRVWYYTLDDNRTWAEALARVAAAEQCRTLLHFEVESPMLERKLERQARQLGLTRSVQRTPMFVTTRDDFRAHVEAHGAPRLLPFYCDLRRTHDILVSRDGTPVGGRWSFDQDNRHKLPKDVVPPAPELPDETPHVTAAKTVVQQRFANNPGKLEQFWLPTTHDQAERWLDDFLVNRFRDFGTYEDALTTRSTFVYHSALAPLLNIGLLTPAQVLERLLEHGARHDVPINDVEGLVRQILGWREFMRGAFHEYCEPLSSRNIWNADRSLTDDWYEGTTGIDPLDHVIRKTVNFGWAHHIERLMLTANLMNLSRIRPQEVYRWFMEMFVDAYDWVMVPNVFGMGLTSDGGIFTTKPYICGSNYVLKMGDFKRGSWCDVMDGLLWQFVATHEETLKANQRLAPMVANLPRVTRRRPEIFDLADEFIELRTRAA